MVAPLVAAGAFLAPIIAAVVIERILNELFQGENPMDRLRSQTALLDAILADLDPDIQSGLKAVLFARTATILADTQSMRVNQLPEILAAVEAIEGGGGGEPIDIAGIWGHTVGPDIFGNPIAANDAVRIAMQGEQSRGLSAMHRTNTNPDFAYRVISADGAAIGSGGFGWLTGLDVRDRAPDQTIADYLTAQTGVTWADVGGHATTTTAPGGTATVPIWCLVAETAAAGADPRLDELVADVNELITRTADTAAADDAILAELDPLILGPVIPLEASGTIDITGARGVLVEVTNIPEGKGRRNTQPPERFYELGDVALGNAGGWGPVIDLEWPATFLPIMSRALTSLSYHVYLPATATVRLLLPVEEG